MKNESDSGFDRAKFWAGLWFRLGEAVVFSLVLFFVIRPSAEDSSGAAVMLPLLSLLIGMFLKSGEQLMVGLANRFLDACQQLFPKSLTGANDRLIEYARRLESWPPSNTDSVAEMNSIVEALKALDGVYSRLWTSSIEGRIRLLFDPSKVNVQRLDQEIKLLGYLARPDRS